MFEAYAIAVTLKLNNLVSPVLAVLSGEFLKLEQQVVALNTALKAAGAEAAGLKSVAAAGSASSAALDKAARSASAFERQLAAIRASAATMPNLPQIPGGGIPIPGAGGGGHGGGGNRNARGGWHGGNIHMGPGGIGLGTVGMAAGDAFVPLAITAGMLYGGHAMYQSAKDLDTERARFKMLGLSDSQNAEAFSFIDGMKVYGSTKAGNTRAFREAQGVFRESGLSGSAALEGAKLAAPVLAKLDTLASAMDGESAAKMHTANMAMLRYVELSGGLKDADSFNRIVDFGYRMNVSSGGTVNWQQLLAFKKTAGVAGYHMTDDALARLEPIMAELSGGRAGTADMTSYNRVTGITRVPNQVAHMLTDMGIWDKSKVDFNSQGGIRNIRGNPLGEANTKLLSENPELFYEKVIRPIYDKMHLSSEEIARQNAAIFGRTGGQFFTAIERALPQIRMSVDALNKAAGIEQGLINSRKALSGQEAEFNAAWTDFKAASGTALLPFFSGLLRAGSTIMRSATANGDTIGPGLKYGGPGGALLGWAAGAVHNAFGGASPQTVAPPTAKSASAADVHLDGHKVGKILFAQASRSLMAPQTGGSLYDPRFGGMPAGGY